MKSFREYLNESNKTIFFTFARMNPPTRGHQRVLECLSTRAGKRPYRIYLSQSHDSTKNPLIYESKLKYARRFFPNQARNIYHSTDIHDVLDVAVQLYNEGYTHINMVVGGDRKTEFENLLKKYNGVESNHGVYSFNQINVISAGVRDPDKGGVEAVSASKLREYVLNEDFIGFSQGLPTNVTTRESKDLFNELRSGMNLTEVKNFKSKLSMNECDLREKYIAGELFDVGDTVLIVETGAVGEITRLCSNYVIVESNGVKQRKWLNDVKKL